MYPRQAAETLAELRDLRLRSRRTLGLPWVVLLLFGGAYVGMAVIAVRPVPAVIPIYWVAFGTGGGALLRAQARRRAEVYGISAPAVRWRTNIVMFVLCFWAIFFAALVSARWALIVSGASVLVGYVALGALARDARPPLAVMPGCVASIVVAALGGRGWIVLLVLGVGLMAGGLVLRAVDGTTT